jgi:hypothetical protein
VLSREPEEVAFMLVTLDLDEPDCRMLEKTNASARRWFRSSISLPDARRRIIVDRLTAQEWRDWFSAHGCHHAAGAIESRLPQRGIRRFVGT